MQNEQTTGKKIIQDVDVAVRCSGMPLENEGKSIGGVYVAALYPLTSVCSYFDLVHLETKLKGIEVSRVKAAEILSQLTLLFYEFLCQY